MAYDATKPADDEYLSAFPAEMREQLRAILQDAIVNALTVNGYSPGNLNGNIPLSNGNLNTNLNADKLDGYDATHFSADGHVHAAATQSTAGFMSNTDKTKLDGVATGAEVNQNAFSNVAVGTETIQADSKTDTLTLAAGANVAITPDATNDKVTIAVTGTVPTASVAGRAISDEGGNVIADTYFPKTGGTISGNLTANEIYANGWLRTIGAYGWYSETYQGGWYMKDADWIRAWNDKGVYTTGKMQADGGFYGALHGTADAATNTEKIGNGHAYMSFHWQRKDGQPQYLWGNESTNPASAADCYVYDPLNFNVNTAGFIRPLSGNANYKLAYTADGQRAHVGEFGRVVMHYELDGETYGVRCDRADLADNSGQLGGLTLAQVQSQILSKVAGGGTPTLTSILDGCYDGNGNKYTKVSNTSTGISGYGTGDIHLTQTYKNFDKILMVIADDNCDFEKYVLWEKWELDYAFNHGQCFALDKSASLYGGHWQIYSGVQAGTQSHPLSTETIWYLQQENSGIVDIIGVKY